MESLKTEFNVNEGDNNKKYFYRGIQTTEVNHYKSHSEIFLDYAFKQKKNMISKVKNKQKLINYGYELEQTISLNLDLLLSFIKKSKKNSKKIIIMNDNKSKDTADTYSSTTASSLIQIIKVIIEKVKLKAEANKKINDLKNKINDRIDENKKYYQKIKEEKFKYKQKLSKTNSNLDNMDNYIIVMNKKFYNIQKHVDKIIVNKKNKILNSNKNIFDFIYANISYNKKIFYLKNILKKFYCEVLDLKIDNDLYKEEKKLYGIQKYKDLVRCMEFYRRTNFGLYVSLRFLKKKYQKIIEIMEFLNLGNIVQFTKHKNEEEGNCEIEFSKINKEDNSIDLFSKMNRNINFSISLDV